MDFREDYVHFSIENSDILNELKEHATTTYDLLNPVILVLDHLIKINFQVEGEELDTLEDIFNIGFHYLYDTVGTIRRILDENFDSEIEELIEFDQLLYLYLRCDEIDSILEGANETISGILDNLDNAFVYKRRLDSPAIKYIEEELEKAEGQTEEITIVDEFMDYCDYFELEII